MLKCYCFTKLYPKLQPSSIIWSEIQSYISIPIDINSHTSIWNFKPNISGPSSDFSILTNSMDILLHAVKMSPLLLCAPTLWPKWVTSDCNFLEKIPLQIFIAFPYKWVNLALETHCLQSLTTLNYLQVNILTVSLYRPTQNVVSTACEDNVISIFLLLDAVYLFIVVLDLNPRFTTS